MSANQVPDIDLDKVMEEIRAEINRRREVDGTSTNKSGSNIDSQQRSWLELNNILDEAENVSHMGAELPPMYKFHGWRRKIAVLIGRIFLRVAQIITRDQRTYNSFIIDAIRILGVNIKRAEDENNDQIQKLEYYIDDKIQKLEHKFNEVAKKAKDDVKLQEIRLKEMENELKQFVNRAREDFEKYFCSIDKQIKETISVYLDKQQNLKTQIEHDLVHVKEKQQNLEKLLAPQRELMDSIINEMKTTQREVHRQKVSLLQQERRLSLLIEEARKRLPEPFSAEQLYVFNETSGQLKDCLYFEFEDQFRGTREDIKNRQRVYLPFISESGAGKSEDVPILDLGCGRGEWLELLKEEKLIARGIDTNQSMVKVCRELDLDVYEYDVLKYLRSQPDGSFGAVTGFHIIEHLPFDILLNLLDETVRVLVSGGLAIFETPNPENILVGSCNFYMDPTHRKPLPSPMMKFLAEARGLCNVEVLNLHPYPDAYKLSGSEIAERLNKLLYGPQDYAVMGWKA